MRQSLQDPRICPQINNRHHRRRSASYTIFDSCTCAATLWFTNLGASNHQSNPTHRKAPTTGDEVHLPFRCDTSCNQRLLLLDLLPLCYWHELLDMVLFYKLTHGLITIDPSLLPLPTNTNNKRATRSSDPDHLSFTTTRCKTSTYQKSYLNRCARLWNALPKELTGKNTSLACFKYIIYTYYKLGRETVYDVDDPRTWKSICCLVISRVICSVKYRVVTSSYP